MHPFWEEQIGCGTLMKSRYNLLKRASDDIEVLYITRTENKCPLKGATLSYKENLGVRHLQEIIKYIEGKDFSCCYFSFDWLTGLPSLLKCKTIEEIHNVLHLRQEMFKSYGYRLPYKEQITKSEELER